MKIRKVKKLIKKSGDERGIKNALRDLKRIKVWKKINNEYSKQNMKVLTGNFMYRGKIKL